MTNPPGVQYARSTNDTHFALLCSLKEIRELDEREAQQGQVDDSTRVGGYELMCAECHVAEEKDRRAKV